MRSVNAINPERFGRYVLLDRIGVGGMAEVFRAVMPGAEGFKRTFVLKRILTTLSQSPSFVEMFVREARIGALLNHPNIVQVYDFGSIEGTYFLAMEYLRGRDVHALMRRLYETKRTCPVSIAAFIAQQVAGGLGYAHALAGPDGKPLDIVHRDVSPANIMCLRAGGVKLLDFGIATSVAEIVPETTERGTFKGKAAYMAPERARSEPFDGRSDLYSLGIVTWELLTGRRLFRGENELATFKNVIGMVVAPPSSLRPDIPAALDAIVMRMLERDPAKRPASGQALADELEDVLAEMKFQSRQLPELLVSLFGSGLQSSQLALAALTPELLAAAGAGESSAPGTGSVTPLAPTVDVPPARSRRRWRAVGATATTVALTLALLVVRSRVGASHAAVANGSTRTPPPKVAEAPPPAPPATAPAPTLEVAAKSPAAPKPRKVVAAGRLGPASRPRVADHRIRNGLSIDPFAEAARGRR